MKNAAAHKIPLDRVSAPLWLLGSLLCATLRYRSHGHTKNDSVSRRDQRTIFCFWHAHLLMIAPAWRNCGVHALISDSRDGDRFSAVAQRWGHEVVRGSSSVNGTFAMRQSIRLLAQGRTVAITPDGPAGITPGAIKRVSGANWFVYVIDGNDQVKYCNEDYTN